MEIDINAKNKDKKPLLSSKAEDFVGGDLIIQKFSRQTEYKKKKSCCLRFCGGTMHQRIAEVEELNSRHKRMWTHCTCAILNIMTCGVLGMLFFCFECLFVNFFSKTKISGQISGDASYSRLVDENDHFVTPQKDITIKDVNKPIETVSQAKLLELRFGITPRQVQQRFMSLNTLLYTAVPLKPYKECEKKKIELGVVDWNDLVNTLEEFAVEFRKGFEKVMKSDYRISRLYKGEYDMIDSDVSRMKQIDLDTQRMFFYKAEVEIFQPKNPFSKKRWQVQLTKDKEQLDEIGKRIDSLMWYTPETYIKTLPKHAKKIFDYGKSFSRWEKCEKNIVKFLAKYEIRVEEAETAKYSEDQKKLLKLYNNFENVILIWKEKKGKLESCQKLNVAEEIQVELRKKMKSSSKLQILKRSSTDDVVNMIRTFYNEILKGRVDILLKYCEEPVKSEINSI